MAHDSPSEFADVSVIIAAYQAAGTIARTLRSIAAQTLKPREAVVVDDGSNDGTAEVAEAEASRMNGVRLRVFRTDDNQGAGAARNRAIGLSTEPWLAFLDADDKWLPEKLERTMSRLEGTDYVLAAHDYWTGEGKTARHHECERRFLEGPDPFVGLYRKGYIPSCSVVARRDAVLAVGGFDPELLNAQDFDLWLEMLKKPGTPFLVFGEPLLRYHLTPDGIMSHTERRLRCGVAIAVRFYPDLKNRPGTALASLWFRVTALHLEALRVYGAQGNIVKLLLTMGFLPLRLAGATVSCLVSPPAPRGRFLTTGGTTGNG